MRASPRCPNTVDLTLTLTLSLTLTLTRCLPLLAANAERAGASLRAHLLPWDDAAAGQAVELLNGGRRFDVVLAADVG